MLIIYIKFIIIFINYACDGHGWVMTDCARVIIGCVNELNSTNFSPTCCIQSKIIQVALFTQLKTGMGIHCQLNISSPCIQSQLMPSPIFFTFVLNIWPLFGLNVNKKRRPYIHPFHYWSHLPIIKGILLYLEIQSREGRCTLGRSMATPSPTQIKKNSTKLNLNLTSKPTQPKFKIEQKLRLIKLNSDC